MMNDASLGSDAVPVSNSITVPNSVSVPNTVTVPNSLTVPSSVTVTDSSSSSGPVLDPGHALDSCPGFVQDSFPESIPGCSPNPDADSGNKQVQNSDFGPDPGSALGLESVRDSTVSCDSRHFRLLRWYSESDLSQESPWLREKHTTLTGGGRRASLTDRPDIYRPIEPATWRTAPDVPSIRVLEVEAPVDPVIVQYGDPVPPDQLAIQQNKVGSGYPSTLLSQRFT